MDAGYSKPKLDVQDKRDLFHSLVGLTDRHLFNHRFPSVDGRGRTDSMAEFALSLVPPEIADAFRTLHREEYINNLDKAKAFTFQYAPSKNSWPHGSTIILTPYMDDFRYSGETKVFIDVRWPENEYLEYSGKHLPEVDAWCLAHLEKEDRVLTTNIVLNDIVRSCNTVGQYKRISEELVGFLPDKYQLALADYTKKSPMPKFSSSATMKNLGLALDTLALASLQAPTPMEESFKRSMGWRHSVYDAMHMPRSMLLTRHSARTIQI